jgi:hypothetical protein
MNHVAWIRPFEIFLKWYCRNDLDGVASALVSTTYASDGHREEQGLLSASAALIAMRKPDFIMSLEEIYDNNTTLNFLCALNQCSI